MNKHDAKIPWFVDAKVSSHQLVPARNKFANYVMEKDSFTKLWHTYVQLQNRLSSNNEFYRSENLKLWFKSLYYGLNSLSGRAARRSAGRQRALCFNLISKDENKNIFLYVLNIVHILCLVYIWRHIGISTVFMECSCLFLKYRCIIIHIWILVSVWYGPHEVHAIHHAPVLADNLDDPLNQTRSDDPID